MHPAKIRRNRFRVNLMKSYSVPKYWAILDHKGRKQRALVWITEHNIEGEKEGKLHHVRGILDCRRDKYRPRVLLPEDISFEVGLNIAVGTPFLLDNSTTTVKPYSEEQADDAITKLLVECYKPGDSGVGTTTIGPLGVQIYSYLLTNGRVPVQFITEMAKTFKIARLIDLVPFLGPNFNLVGSQSKGVYEFIRDTLFTPDGTEGSST